MSLLDKIKKNSTIKDTVILSKSSFIHDKSVIQTSVPMFNVALSGHLDGGITSGLTVLAGPSKHFKTAFSLFIAKSYMDFYDNAVLLFYDSEFGTPKKYFDSFGIDMDRVIHTPILNIEQLKFDITKQLMDIDRDDKLIIVVDSIGNLASKKEIDDALDEKSVADMTRAKQLKSLFRIVTPHLTMKDIPMIVVNHVYKEQGVMYPKDIVSGGTGVTLSSDTIFIIGRQQDKEGKEVVGYDFIINVEKSRYVKEKSKIPITVSFDSGIEKYSGLMDVALEGGFVDKPSNGWYSKIDRKTGELGPKKRFIETLNGDFWGSILNDPEFKDYISKKYCIAYGNILGEDKEIMEEIDE